MYLGPNAPSNLKVDISAIDSITLSWDHDGPASDYLVCCMGGNCNGSPMDNCNAVSDTDGNDSDKTAAIGDLQPNTLHMFAVQAVCMSSNAEDSQMSDPSDTVDAATSEWVFMC